jgi:hypothetical protein
LGSFLWFETNNKVYGFEGFWGFCGFLAILEKWVKMS